MNLIKDQGLLTQAFLNPPLFSHVMHGPRKAKSGAVGVELKLGFFADMGEAAVGSDNAVVDFVVMTIFQSIDAGLICCFPVFGMDEFLRRPKCIIDFGTGQTKKTVGFVRGTKFLCAEILLPAAKVGDFLGTG